MAAIRTILCPVDLSPLSEGVVRFAAGLCRALGARLVLHHSLVDAAIGLSMGWMWHQEHADGKAPTEEQVESRLKALLAMVPAGVPAEARLSSGVVAPAVLALADQVRADLIVVGTRGASTEEHASVAERLLAEARCAVVVLRESSPVAALPPRAGEGTLPLLVAVDFSPAAMAAVGYAFDLARMLPLTIDLLHVAADQGKAEAATVRLSQLVAQDLRDRVRCRAEAGQPDEVILANAERLGAAWIVMGMHPRSLFGRFFARDTAAAVLRRGLAPTWFVPARS